MDGNYLVSHCSSFPFGNRCLFNPVAPGIKKGGHFSEKH
jgi:hypothetical protein